MNTDGSRGIHENSESKVSHQAMTELMSQHQMLIKETKFIKMCYNMVVYI